MHKVEEKETIEEIEPDVNDRQLANNQEEEHSKGCMADSKLDGGRQASRSTQFFSAREQLSPSRTKSDELSGLEFDA